MSKRVTLLAVAALLGGVLAAAPAFAASHGHHGSSRHGSSHHGSSHRGSSGHGGWSGPRVYFGFGARSFYFGDPYDYGAPYYYYGDPYYYAPPPPPPPPDCDWEQVRVWSRGHWVWQRVWRCY